MVYVSLSHVEHTTPYTKHIAQQMVKSARTRACTNVACARIWCDPHQQNPSASDDKVGGVGDVVVADDDDDNVDENAGKADGRQYGDERQQRRREKSRDRTFSVLYVLLCTQFVFLTNIIMHISYYIYLSANTSDDKYTRNLSACINVRSVRPFCGFCLV